MGLWARLLGAEKRSGSEEPAQPRNMDAFLRSVLRARNPFGLPVTPAEAQHALAVAFRCISLISEALSAVPLHVYRTSTDGGSEPADDLPLYVVLQDQASPRHSAFEAREILIRSVLETGNGYARIERDGRGAVRAIYPLMPFMVGVERLSTGRLRYRVNDPSDGSMVLVQEEVLHIRYHTRDGILGVSPLTWAGGAIGLAVEAANLATQQTKEGLVPPGFIELPPGQELSQAQYDRMVEGFGRAFTEWRRGRAPFVLEGGAKFNGISHSAQQAELTDARKLSLQDVARVFGVPTSVLGLNDRPTYGSVEEEAKALIRTCLAPWCRRIENAMERALLTEHGRRTLWIEHDLNGLLRGDQAARYAAYAVGINNGFLSANEARRAENMRARPDGDRFLEPMNMRPQGGDIPSACQ